MKTIKLASAYQNCIYEFASYFNAQGYELYLVGGACRDILLKKESFDFDFTTNALPETIIDIFSKTRHKVIKTGLKHGTLTIRFKGNNFEVTTFRIDGDYQDKRHPQNVSFKASLQEDLSRRDFTINALAVLINSKQHKDEPLEIIDLFGGLEDLKNKKLKAIGNPTLRFTEDALRILRLFRFMSQLNFDIEQETLNAATNLASNLNHISNERKQSELKKILLSENSFNTFVTMQKSKVLDYLLPQLSACVGVNQNHHHSYDVFYHTLYTLKATQMQILPLLKKSAKMHEKDLEKQKLQDEALIVCLAALCHDLGKPITQQYKTTINAKAEYSFHNHQIHSGKITTSLLRQLKFSNIQIERVTKLVENHMILGCTNWSEKKIKEFIIKVGKENINLLYTLIYCDRKSHLEDGSTSTSDLEYLFTKIKTILKNKEPLEIKDLQIDGNKIIALGCPTGKKIGVILNKLLAMVLEEKELNNQDELEKRAKQLIATL